MTVSLLPSHLPSSFPSLSLSVCLSLSLSLSLFLSLSLSLSLSPPHSCLVAVGLAILLLRRQCVLPWLPNPSSESLFHTKLSTVILSIRFYRTKLYTYTHLCTHFSFAIISQCVYHNNNICSVLIACTWMCVLDQLKLILLYNT